MQIYVEILQQKCTTKESTLLTMGNTPLKKPNKKTKKSPQTITSEVKFFCNQMNNFNKSQKKSKQTVKKQQQKI